MPRARVLSMTSSSTPTVNTDNYDVVQITNLATTVTGVTVSGSPSDYDQLLFHIKDNGTAKSITWGSSFESKTETLPTATTDGADLLVQFHYLATDSKWACTAVGTGTPYFAGQVGPTETLTFQLDVGANPPTVDGNVRGIYAGTVDDNHFMDIITPVGLNTGTATRFVAVFPHFGADEDVATEDIGLPYASQQQMTKLTAHFLDRGWGVVALRAGQSAGVDKWGVRTTREAIPSVLTYVASHFNVSKWFFFGMSMGCTTMFNVAYECIGSITITGFASLDGVCDLRDMYDSNRNVLTYHPSHDQTPNKSLNANTSIADAYGIVALSSPTVAKDNYDLTNATAGRDLDTWVTKVETEGGTGSGVGHNPINMDLSTVPQKPIWLYWNDGDSVVDSNYQSELMATRLSSTYSWSNVTSVDLGAAIGSASHLDPASFQYIADHLITSWEAL